MNPPFGFSRFRRNSPKRYNFGHPWVRGVYPPGVFRVRVCVVACLALLVRGNNSGARRAIPFQIRGVGAVERARVGRSRVVSCRRRRSPRTARRTRLYLNVIVVMLRVVVHTRVLGRLRSPAPVRDRVATNSLVVSLQRFGGSRGTTATELAPSRTPIAGSACGFDHVLPGGAQPVRSCGRRIWAQALRRSP